MNAVSAAPGQLMSASRWCESCVTAKTKTRSKNSSKNVARCSPSPAVRMIGSSGMIALGPADTPRAYGRARRALDSQTARLKKTGGAAVFSLAGMHTAYSADGTAIAYETCGQGPPLILVDGALCYRKMGPSRAMAEALGERFTVVTYDRRGRGLRVPVRLLVRCRPRARGGRTRPSGQRAGALRAAVHRRRQPAAGR